MSSRSPIFRNSDDRFRALERRAMVSGDLNDLRQLLAEALRLSRPFDSSWVAAIAATSPGVDEWREVLATIPADQHAAVFSPIRDVRVWTFLVNAMGGPDRVPAWAEQPLHATLEQFGSVGARISRAGSLHAAWNRLMSERQRREAMATGPLAELAIESERGQVGAGGGLFRVRDYVAEPQDGDTLHESEIGRLDEHTATYPRPEHFWVPRFLSSGDYVPGDSISRANRDVFLSRWGDIPGVHSFRGSYGFSAVAIRLRGDYPEGMLNDLIVARDGEDLDDVAREALEAEERDEAWSSWIDHDFRRALREVFPELDDSIDDLSDAKLRKLFFDAAWTLDHDDGESPWDYGPQGAEIDVDRVARHGLTDQAVLDAIAAPEPEPVEQEVIDPEPPDYDESIDEDS